MKNQTHCVVVQASQIAAYTRAAQCFDFLQLWSKMDLMYVTLKPVKPQSYKQLKGGG